MNGFYDGRQRAANWRPADPGDKLGPVPGWYRELLGGLVEDLTRWREPEERPRAPRRQFPRRSDPRWRDALQADPRQCTPRHERDRRSGRRSLP
jgi:hypothetical protein